MDEIKKLQFRIQNRSQNLLSLDNMIQTFWNDMKMHLPVENSNISSIELNDFLVRSDQFREMKKSQKKLQRSIESLQLSLLAMVENKLRKQSYPPGIEDRGFKILGEVESCCICLKEYAENEFPTQLSGCSVQKHVMCVPCFRKYIATGRDFCPICFSKING